MKNKSKSSEGKGIKEKCPNCLEQDENIKPMPDGSCGVCGGKGYIEWKRIGKIMTNQKSLDKKKSKSQTEGKKDYLLNIKIWQHQ